MTRPAPEIPIGATVGAGWRLTFSRLGRWLLVTAVVQGAVALLAAPLLVELFQVGLGAAGISSLTVSTAGDLLGSPGSIALLFLLLLLAVAALAAQSAIIVSAANGQQGDAERRVPSPGAIARAVGSRFRRLARPSTLVLLPYLLLLAPLGHVAVGSVITSWIAVPNFISGELMRSPSGTALWIGILVVLWYVNIRFVLTLPFLFTAPLTVPQAMRASWRATRWVPWRTVIVILGVIVPATAALVVLGGVALGATALADATAPDAAPIVAAIAFAVAQVVGFFVIGIAVVVQTQSFVSIVRRAREDAIEVAASSARPVASKTGRRIVTTVVVVASAGAVVALSFAAAPVLDRYSDGTTLVIAHRGDTTAAVENTIPALEAAHDAGADFVEFDVQQTKDGDWVVMHDFDLGRLAGIGGAVADMTLQEATAVTVRENGHEAKIPSMREWVRRAHELGQPLLIEIKPHGGETEDYLDSFFAILDEEGVTDTSIYHSLSEAVVEGQEALRPDLTVGLIVAFSLGNGVPPTSADFIVIEESGYSDSLLATLHDEGRGLFVWTVNDESAMRGYLRDGVDGIVTDQIALLAATQDAVADETGLAPKLLDALNRAVTLW